MTPALTLIRPPGRYTAPPEFLEDEVADAELSIVNLAARQRMLSQRLILLVILAARGDALKLGEARSTLELFTRSQQVLLDSPTKLNPLDSARVRTLYHGPQGVASVIEEFTLLMDTALVQIDRHDGAARSSIQQLIESTDVILQALDQATVLFDDIDHAQATTAQQALSTMAGELAALADVASSGSRMNDALHQLARKAATLAQSNRLKR